MSDSEKRPDGNKAHQQSARQQFWDWINTTGFWILLVFGAVLIVTIILLAFSTRDTTVRAAILAAGIPAVLTFIVVVIQAAVTKQMAVIMERQETEMTLQRQAAQDQRQAMHETLNLMRDNFYISERAYVYVKRIEPQTELTFNGPLSIEIECVNTGNTPAWNLIVTSDLYIENAVFVPPPHTRNLKFSEKGRFVPANGSAISISRSPKTLLWPEIQDILRGSDLVYLIGLCTYTDFTGANHSESFDVMLHVSGDSGQFINRDSPQILFRLTEKGKREMEKRKTKDENPN